MGYTRIHARESTDGGDLLHVVQDRFRFANAERTIRYAMNNSFGFGGNNASLVVGKA